MQLEDTSAPALLMVRDLAVVYGGAIRALQGVNLVVREGSVVALLGANGAGKTTLLRAVSGLLRPNNGAVRAGTIEFRGASALGVDASVLVRRGIAQVMEARRIFAELTVDENLKAGAHTRRNRAEVRANYERVLELFPRLAERRTQTAGYLSGGEQQMVAIGRALMASPTLLLLDEPSLGLAPLIVEQIGAIIAEINRQGTSVLLVEQNAAMALALADYAYVLEHGVVAKRGTAEEMRADTAIQEFYLGGDARAGSDFRAMRDAFRANALTPGGLR
ncbi:MAG: ABC transporter ATP-binding protein [Acidimicrobiia bacterium]